MKVEVDVLSFLSLIVLTVSVDVKNLKLELKWEPNQTGIFGPIDSNRNFENKKKKWRKKRKKKHTTDFSRVFGLFKLFVTLTKNNNQPLRIAKTRL